MVAVPMGILILIPISLGDSLKTYEGIIRAIQASVILMLVTGLILGTTFFRTKNNRLHYTSSLFSWSSMNIDDIEAITLVPRFFFTSKVTAVQIERRSPGMFPGMLISRDAFPDETIAALVSHLKHLNPSIALDEGVQEIVRSQGMKED